MKDLGMIQRLIVYLSMTIVFAVLGTSGISAQTLTPITPTTEVEVGLGFPHYCGSFSGDSQFLVVQNDGIYDTRTWERVLEIPTVARFNPDSTLVAVEGEGVYETDTFERVFESSSTNSMTFSDNGNYLLIENVGVYEVETWEQVLVLGDGLALLSPDGTTVMVADRGIYDVETGDALLIGTGLTFFSPDSTLAAVVSDGVYDLATGERLLPLYGAGHFSNDGKLLVVWYEGVYEVGTWTLRFTVSNVAQSSPDNSLIVVFGDGVYNASSGTKLYAIQGNIAAFDSTSTLLAVGGDYTYVADTGERLFALPTYGSSPIVVPLFSPDGTLLSTNTMGSCVIYGVVGTDWAYRSGVVHIDNALHLHESPSGSELESTVHGDEIVFARSSDSNWFQVLSDDLVLGWIPASQVEIRSMPDGVPIETD
jgi:hypothetical protein